MVAVGLMALLMSMIFTIFFQASQAFRLARASVEVHQNARAAFDAMLRDFAAAKMVAYNPGYTGYFAVGWERTRPFAAGDPDDKAPDRYAPSITFTTYADQAGAVPLVPGVSPQLALVRYALEWDGGAATLVGDDPRTATVEGLAHTYQVPTHRLIKRVRFPQTAYYYCDMNEFTQSFLTDETVASDVLAFGVLSMRVRFLYGGRDDGGSDFDFVNVLDYGRASGGSGVQLVDADSEKKWTEYTGLTTADYVRFLGGNSAPQVRRQISAAPTDTIIPAGFMPAASANSAYRIEDGPIASRSAPEWIELLSRGAYDWSAHVWSDDSFGKAEMYPMRVIEDVQTYDTAGVNTMQVRMPYLVEVTLELTDRRSVRQHTFTQRFHIPSSEH